MAVNPAIQPLPRRRSFPVGKLLTLLVLFVAAGAAGWWGYQQFTRTEAPVAAGTPSPVQRQNIVSSVSASGTVATQATARPAFRQNGILEELNVTVGQRIEAGQVIGRLTTADLDLAVRRAENDVASARARLQALESPTVSSADIASAQASLTSAVANLAKAQQDRQTLFTPPSQDELTVALADLELKRQDLIQAQSNYDRVSWRPDIGIQPEATALQRATIAYETAQANYNIRNAGPKDADVANADRNIEIAQANVASARARINQLYQGPSGTDVTIQTTALANAEISLEQARRNLENAQLVAPISGVVTEVRFQPGETVQGNLVTIIDPDRLKVDVNVDEINVARLQQGQPATVTFDALQGTNIRGQVGTIAPAAVVNQGVSTFPVSILLDQPGGARPGMNATVNVTTDRRDGVLAVPNRAIRTQGRARVVTLQLPDGTTETRPIQVGISNDQFTEVVSGLQEGDVVIIPGASTTQRTNVPGVPGAGGAGAFGGGGFPGGGAIPVSK